MTREPSPGWLFEVPLAHRGLWGDGVPENSLAAFEAARTAGVGMELDARLAADGHAVVFHDRGLDRLAGATGLVADRTATALAELSLDGTGQHVPTLVEALRAAGDQPVMVEVKADRWARARPLAAAVASVLAEHPGPTCVASFSPAVLYRFRRHRPGVPRVLTSAPTRLGRSGQWVLANLAAVRLVDPVAVSYDLGGLDLPAVQRLRTAGTPLVTWTVRTPADLAVARESADNLIFERLPVPEVLARERTPRQV